MPFNQVELAKSKTVYFCQQCGHQSPKWLGQCPSCKSWNSFVEENISPEKTISMWKAGEKNKRNAQPQIITEIKSEQSERIITSDDELNRVLGGGIVQGSICLMSGEPGIGKSTLLLQLALRLSNHEVIYISGEESEQQIKLRAGRIGQPQSKCFVLTETSLENVFARLNERQPSLVIIDSIQTMYSSKIESSPGSVSQIRECTAELLRYSKESNVPVILVGHITKDGSIAGPKVLEHMVDVVLQFEGDHQHVYRILRALKNRYGSTNEIGIYEMQGSGLREVSNPSEVLIAQRDEGLSGSAIASTMEGMRPLLIEVQALVSSAVYGTPQRSCTGFDMRRLSMLLAVLEKRCGFRLGAKDVFLNIAGGIKVEDPAIDLAVISAILSSNEDMAIPPHTAFAAEVGLSGEIRPVNKIEQRLSEASKMSFEKIFVSKYNLKGLDLKRFSGIEIIAVSKVEEVFQRLFG